MVEEQATLAELQKIADEVSEILGAKPIKVRLTPRITDGFDLVLGLRLVLVSRTWADQPNFEEFRFRLAYAVCERQIPERAVLQYAVVASLVISFLLILYRTPAFLIFLATSTFSAWYLPNRQARAAKTEPFLRKLLSATNDPERILQWYTYRNLPEAEFAKVDALVHQLARQAPKPAGT